MEDRVRISNPKNAGVVIADHAVVDSLMTRDPDAVRGPGHRTEQTLVALDQRDELIREAARIYFGGASAAAAEKLIMLRQHAADLHAAIPTFEARQEAAQVETAHQTRIAQLTRPRVMGGHGMEEDAAQVTMERKALDKATATLQRLDELIEVRTAKWRDGTRIVQAVDEFFLAGGIPRGCAVEEVEPPKLAKNGNLVEAIERERHRIRELRADAHRVASCPFPSSHTKRRMREAIEALAERGRPSVSRLVELDGAVEFADVAHQIPIITDKDAGIASLVEPDALALIAWLFKPAMIAALDAEITAESDDKIALSEKQRGEQLAQIDQDIIEHERVEAALTWTAWAQGVTAEHRPDIKVLALLVLRLITAPRAEPSGTTPGHSVSFAVPGAR